jgi:hypothetical protein
MLSILALVVACGVLSLCLSLWRDRDPQREAFLQAPGAVRVFIQSAGERKESEVNTVPPLVAQAQLGFRGQILIARVLLTLGSRMGRFVSWPDWRELWLLGETAFLDRIERLLHRIVRPAKRGPKPRRREK